MPDQPTNDQKPNTLSAAYRRFIGLSLLVMMCVVMTGYWLLNSSSGLQWMLSSISRMSSGTIHFIGVQGTLHDLHIQSIRFSNEDFELTFDTISANWNPRELLHKQIHINHLSVTSLHIHKLSQTSEHSQPVLPDRLTLPFGFALDALNVASVQFTSGGSDNAEVIISNLALSLQSNGDRHQLTLLNGHTPWGAVLALVELDGNTPFPVSARIDLSGVDPWDDTRAVMNGNLEHMTIQVTGTQSVVKKDLKAQLRPFSANPLVQLDIDLEQLNPARFLSSAPSASLSVSAHLAPNSDQQLEGQVHIRNPAATTIDQGGLPFSSISALVSMTPEYVQLTDIQGEINAHEAVRGELVWHWKEQSGSANVLVNRLNPQHIDSRVHAAQISGQISASAQADTQSARITLKDQSLHLTANVMRISEVITLEQFTLRRKQSQLTGHGKLDSGEKQAFQLSAQLANFNIAEFIQAPASNLNAAFNVSGQLSPHLSGMIDYTIQNSRIAKSAVTGDGQLQFNGLDQLMGKAKLAVGSNQFLLQGGSGKSGDTYQLTINAPALEHMGFGLAGDVHAHAALKGNRASPDISFNLSSRQLHLPGNHHLSGFAADGQLQREAIALNLDIKHYTASGKSLIKDINFQTNGTLSDHAVSASAHINDDITLQLKAMGGITSRTALSSLHWNGQLVELSTAGKIPIRLKSPAPLSISQKSVSLGHAPFSVSDGLLRIDQIQWTPKTWKTQGHFSGIAVYPGNPQKIHSPAVQMGGHWDFISNNRLTGNLHIQRERGDWHLPGEIPQPAGLDTLQLRVAAQNDRITSTFELISQHLGNAKAHLTIPIKQSNHHWSIAEAAPLNGEVIAHINNLKWLDALFGNSTAVNGQLHARAHITGTLSKPDFHGTVTGKELSILLLEQGIDLQQGKLAANFHHDNLMIDRLHFVTPHPPPPKDRLLKNMQLNNSSGSLTINGNIGLIGNDSYLNFKLNELPIAHKTDYWIIASGSGQARLHETNLTLKGDVVADTGLLLQSPENRPELAEDIVFVNVTPDPSPQKLSLHLDMNLKLGEKFFIRASGLEGRLAGQLQVLNDQKNKLKVNGSITAQDTTFKAYGQDLTVKRGIVSFQGPLDDPGLNVLAIREGLQVEAGVEIMGSVRHPQVKLVSTPNVSETEKLSWIVLGRKPDPSGLDATALLSAAGSILGGQSGSGITDQITRTLGLDELTVRQAGVGSSLSGQIGVVGKRISSRAYVSYERSLATTTMGITKLTYNLTPRITVVTQAGEDNAADLFYTLQFD